MQVSKNVTAAQALQGFIQLARANKLSADEHDHFALLAQVIGQELQEGLTAKQELQALKAEHAKCAQQSSGTDSESGSVASEGNGAHVAQDRSIVEPPLPIQEFIQ